MSKLLILTVAAAALGWVGCATDPSIEPATPHRQIVALTTGDANQLEPFMPEVTSRTDRWGRHVPMLYAVSPWGKTNAIQFEVPEYVHGRAPGDRRRGFLFSGRSLATAAKIGGVRYASLEKPQWRKIAGGLALDNPLADGLTIRFRVIAYDRMLEVRMGLTNDGDKPIRNSWAQICFKGVMEPVLAERHPTSSWMLADDKLITWDAAGQDLSWVDKERADDGKRFKRSCFFKAEVGTGKITGRTRLDSKYPQFRLGRKVDLPALAKADADKKRAVVVYSPTAVRTFYNVLQPCYHADPYLGEVPAKSTRWTRTYLMFVEGDLEAFMQKLSAAHKKIKAAKEARN